jgi:nicotinamide-nucleotide amidase
VNEPTERDRAIDDIASRALERGAVIAVAESLTSGLILSELGRGEDAAEWFAGGAVTYSTTVKQRLLGVTPGPVITAQCAEEMASGVARRFDADIAISTTGAGGPDAEEGRPAGTVYFGWAAAGRTGSELHHFDGPPAAVLDRTVDAALRLLRRLLHGENR